MSGTHINVEKIKKIMDAKMPQNNLRFITMRNQILDTCANRGKNININSK